MNAKLHRTTSVIGILVIAGALCSLAATQVQERRDAGIEGRWVDVIGESGSNGEISNEVSIHALGGRDFLVKRQKLEGSETVVDVWIPLEKVRSLIVYDSKDDALKHCENGYGFVADYEPAPANK